MRLIPVAVACAVGSLLAVAAPVSAGPLEREHYSGTDSWTFTDQDCGAPITIDASAEFSGLFMLKAGRRGDPTPYFVDNYSSVVTYTNAANGKAGMIVSNGMWKDLHIELIEGTTYRFTTLESGRPVIAFGPDGERLIFDRGRILWTFVVDTLGDADLSNDVFIQDPEPTSIAGPHPALEGTVDFCDFLDLLR
jgi:hypothetical protein